MNQFTRLLVFLIGLGLCLIETRHCRAADPAASSLALKSPLDYQVFQRQTRDLGTVTFSGRRTTAESEIQVRIIRKSPADWKTLTPIPDSLKFSGEIPTPAGGWFRVEVREVTQGKTLSEIVVEHVGVGEVFVVAGQSN